MQQITLLSASVDSDDDGSALDLGASGPRCLCAEAVVSAVEGTDPVLSLVLETSADGTSWETLEEWEAISAADTFRILPDRAQRYVRVSWEVAGTDSPAFMAKISAWSFDSYCSPKEFAALGLQNASIANVQIDVVGYNLEQATSDCKVYIEKFYTLPLIAWSPSLTGSVAKICAYNMMSVKGFSTTAGDNSYFRQRYNDAILWLEGVAKNGAPDTEGSPDAEDTTEGSGSSFAVASDCRRGW